MLLVQQQKMQSVSVLVQLAYYLEQILMVTLSWLFRVTLKTVRLRSLTSHHLKISKDLNLKIHMVVIK